MYIAVEYLDDGTINDTGQIDPTKEGAWAWVAHVFDAKSTKIHLISDVYYTVKEKKLAPKFKAHY